MKQLFKLTLFFSIFMLLLNGTKSLLADELHGILDGGAIGWYQCGAPVLLNNTGNYDWWHGCSPTSAGMVMGYYDRNGYQSQAYDNLVPGGVAEANTFGPGPYLVNSIIASAGHIADFYSGGNNASNDDNPPPWHSFDCLADFMGTSQDSVGNANGWTMFYYWLNGKPWTPADDITYGVQDKDGMYGIGEYVNYAGYDYKTLYTQLIYSETAPYGFTYAQYMAEIDAGRPVMIQIEGHSMYGYGYDAANSLVYVYDTWNPNGQNPGVMTWGGTYAGMDHWGVEVLELAPVPEPSTLAMLAGLGVMFAVGYRRRRGRS
ncbi:MAG: PEP-CTERM sorting domain-containing protein [Thermoguttaceae bacterium]